MTQATDIPRDANHLAIGGPSSMVYVRTLGGASIDAGATHLTPASVRKFALLFYLWAERGRSVTRATLHDLMFPEQTAVNARHSIRELIYQFRKLGARIASDGEAVELAPDSVRADYSDVLTQERPNLEQLQSAASGFMPGYAPTHSETFTEWLEAFRGRATSELNRVFVAELNRARKLGDWTLVESAAQAVLALDPLHEEATFATAELLAIGGAKAKAVKLLDRYAEEVGVASPELKLPAAVLRRRISERSREIYRAPLTLPFLGRDAEIAALQERFERAKAGEAQCAVLVGEAGIGKTRLAEELCAQAVLAGASVERVAMQPHDVHRPMATFSDLVPKLLNLPGALGCSPESMAALRRLTANDLGDASVALGEANSEAVASSISRAIADLIDSIANEAPLLILVDDAQWTDERSLQTLAALAAGRQSRQLMIVLTSRERSVRQFLAQRAERVLGLSLALLANSSARQLTKCALQETAADHELRDWIASTSGGNPFFLKCLVGHYQATGERFVVPTSLSVLLDQKVAALSSKAAAVLGTCVALGRHSTVGMLLGAIEMPQIELQLAVAELEAAHLVVMSGSRIEAAHSLIAECIERQTPPVVLRLIHRRVASLLQTEAERANSTALLWDCAEHWTLSGEPERAADSLRWCASRALEIGRPREAAEVLLRGAATASRETAIPLATEAVDIADWAHEGHVVTRAIRLLRQLDVRIEGNRLELAELKALVSGWNNPENATDRLRAWLAPSVSLDDRLAAGTTLLIAAEVDNRPDIARLVHDLLLRELPSPDAGGDSETLMPLLIYHSTFGDSDRVTAIAARLLDLSKTASAAVRADICRKCGVAFWRLGQVERAFHAYEQWHASAKAAGLVRAQFDAANTLQGVSFDLGLPDVDTWSTIVDSMVSDDPELAQSPNYVFQHLEFACCSEDLAEARKWLDVCRHVSEASPIRRTERWARAFEMRVRQLRGILPSVDEARRLVDSHKPDSEIGDVADFEVAVAVWVCREHGELDRGRDLVTRYLGVNRRTRNPPGRPLRLAMQSLGL